MTLLYPGQGNHVGHQTRSETSRDIWPYSGTLTMLDLELDTVDSALLRAISQESQHPITLPLQAQSWALPT